ncbi:hypothetical protein RVU85_005180 [Citrobacter freundii]|nr:hypothetical protein [Citrobacter freundii]ELK6042020.1 hypothetical protein [Citrobacter freundii]
MSELAQESIGTNDFEKWLNERSNWLQTAAKQLIENKRLPNEVELTELVRLCKLEAAKEGANKRGNSSRLTQSFHFFMFEPIFSPVNALNQPI